MAPAIDLHTHTSVSDGTESPAELVRAALDAGLTTIALTDHDSTAGWQEAFSAAAGSTLTVIPGMELSTRHQGKSVHLLAYLFDPLDAGLLEETARIREARLHRAETIVQRIAADYPITWSDVLAQTATGTTIGRPHIADALVALGIVADRGEAFSDILHPRSGYFQDHYAPEPVDAVRLVRAAGGVPVLAHPGTRGRERVLAHEQMEALVEAGLFGLEIHHRENTESGKAALFELAEEFGLAITGSSDYHGAGKPNRLGENTTEPTVLADLLAAGHGADTFRG
jgi:hypothetical protein